MSFSVDDLVLDPLTADPTPAVAGMIWYRSDLQKVRFYDASLVAHNIDMLGGPAGVRDALAGIDSGNVYHAPTDNFDDTTATISILVSMEVVPPGTETIFGNFNVFEFYGGWNINADATGFSIGIGSSAAHTTSSAASAPYPPNPVDRTYLLTLTIDTICRLYVNGVEKATVTPPGGYLPPDVSCIPMLGDRDGLSSAPAESWRILGVAYKAGAESAGNVLAHFSEVDSDDEWIEGATISWDNFWSFDGEATPPATLSDTIGSIDFTKQGTSTFMIGAPIDFDGTGGTTDVAVDDDGTEVTAAVTRLNFAGAGVVVTEPSQDEVTVTIAGGGGGDPDALKSVKITNTDTTTNLNTSTAAVFDELTGVVDWNDDAALFTPNLGSGTVTVLKTGRYRISWHAEFSGAAARANIAFIIQVNGVQRGPRSQSNYIRNSSGHLESSDNQSLDLELNANDVIRIWRQARSSTTATVSLDGTENYFQVEYLKA